MNTKFEKFLVMPIVVPITPSTLVIPGTKPLYQQQQVIAGALRWSTPDWNEAEYNKVQSKVNSLSLQGMRIEVSIMKLAEAVASLLPDRDFSITLASFMIEHKADKKKEAKK